MLELKYSTYELEAGCDEAGRGCLAGPVFAAAVILPNNFKNVLLNDSKQLSEKKRNQLRGIIENEALDYAVAQVSEREIEKINIARASVLAVHKALTQLKMKPDFVLMDGKFFLKWNNTKHQTIIKGDAKYSNIAAASVLAKTYRDEWMQNLHSQYPQYNWQKNKGYPTKAHREMIKKHGITQYHRKTFKLLDEQQKLF